MRRIIAILLALTLLLSLAACGSGGEEKEQINEAPESSAEAASESIPEETAMDPTVRKVQNWDEAGYWEMVRIDSDNPDFAVTEEQIRAVKKQGTTMYLELLDDGTGIFSSDTATQITWGDRSVTVEGESYPFITETNRLILDMGELVCTFCKADKPGSRIPEMEQAGFAAFMEVGKVYPYTTICSEDESKLTTGEATVIAYEIFSSAEDYPQREGYEWRVATIEARFFDENAQKYGIYVFTRHEDYYNVKLFDDSEVELDESDDYYSYTHSRIHLGQEIESYMRIRESWSKWKINAKGEDEVFYNVEFAVQVPEGYDGSVLGLENGNYEYPDGSYITQCDPAYFLVFRMD